MAPLPNAGKFKTSVASTCTTTGADNWVQIS